MNGWKEYPTEAHPLSNRHFHPVLFRRWHRLADAPIFTTKNGYGNMVIMSMKRYEESLAKLDVYAKLDEADLCSIALDKSGKL